MKQCPRCFQTYSDDQLNFCLDDGQLLREFFEERPSRFADDSPPTIALNDVRRTNPTRWPQTPATPWQPQQNLQYRPPAHLAWGRSKNQTIPTVALVLGILSLIFSCCYGGIWLGIPAIVLGFIGMRNADNDSQNYGGRGMTMAGMITGFLSLVVFFIMIAFLIAGSG